MAAKKAKKPATQSGQGYSDRYKKKRDLQLSKDYMNHVAEAPSYGGLKGMKKFIKDYEAGKIGVSAKGVARSMGDLGGERALSRLKTAGKRKK